MMHRKLHTKDQDIWITSDIHFFHKGVLEFCKATRPWTSVEEMTEALIGEWNSKVKPTDIIFHLGDFSFKGKEATQGILDQLNGNIVFVLGNHDKVLRSSIKHKPTYDYLELRINGVKVIMSHYPMSSWNQQGGGSVMLHGHCHGSFVGGGRIADVGYDSMGSIVNLEGLLISMQEIEVCCADHHKIL